MAWCEFAPKRIDSSVEMEPWLCVFHIKIMSLWNVLGPLSHIVDHDNMTQKGERHNVVVSG
jgi:hypothetical protein